MVRDDVICCQDVGESSKNVSTVYVRRKKKHPNVDFVEGEVLEEHGRSRSLDPARYAFGARVNDWRVVGAR